MEARVRHLWILAVLIFVCLTSSVPHARWLPFAPSGAAVASRRRRTDLGAAPAITEQEAGTPRAAGHRCQCRQPTPRSGSGSRRCSAGLVLVIVRLRPRGHPDHDDGDQGRLEDQCCAR